MDTIELKSVFEGAINVTYIDCKENYNSLLQLVRELFQFDNHQSFTIKFIDDEGDPCTISSELEYNEAIRLTLEESKILGREPEMTIHIFSGVPVAPGLPCPGEDKSIYRRGARRWKKLYHLNGHTFQPRRFNKITPCVLCGDQIWGLGRQGFKCLRCKLMVHKKCHKLLQIYCPGNPPINARINASYTGSSSNFMTSPRPLCSRNGTGPSKKRTSDKTKATTKNGNRRERDECVVYENGARHHAYHLDDFDLIKVIGRGSYAKVLLVELRETKRRYAMKVIKKEIVAEDEDIDWVQTEKRVFEIATGCDFLVGLHSCFQTTAKLFYVIEFVSGGDLMYHMQRKRRLPEDHARFYAAEISLALNYLHEKFIIYRDLKLDNVLLDQYGHIKLTDYGMCKENMRPGETANTFCGTPNYISPEMIDLRPYSFSVDWWALGVLLYEMLTGRSPFVIPNERANGVGDEESLFEEIKSRRIRIPRSIPVRAQNVLKGFLDKCPDTRLGCSPEGDKFQDIKNHPFFRLLDWDLLAEKKIDPPYVPRIDDPLEHFDPAFTNQPIRLTPPDMQIINKIDQSEFDGFEFVNPEIMTIEEAV